MKVSKVLQDNAIFDAAVLDLTNDSILTKFKKAIKIQAQLSLGSGLPSAASAPHSILNSFKNMAAVSASCGYEFKEAKALLLAAASAPAGGAPAASAKVEEVVETKKEEVE